MFVALITKLYPPFELDSDGERELTGGQYLAVASVEYSYPVAKNWRAAAFVDVGNASEELFKWPCYGFWTWRHMELTNWTRAFVSSKR